MFLRSASSPTSRKTWPSPRGRPDAIASSPAALSRRICRVGNGWIGYLQLQIVIVDPDRHVHFSIELLPLYLRPLPRGGEERRVIRIGAYNKMTIIFSPGSSSVSKLRVVHAWSHGH